MSKNPIIIYQNAKIRWNFFTTIDREESSLFSLVFVTVVICADDIMAKNKYMLTVMRLCGVT